MSTQNTNSPSETHTSSAEANSFQPYVPAGSKLPEFTLRAVLFGILFGIIFGITSLYVALKIGFTAGASVPTAVIVIAVLKRFFRSSILENNLVQTIASAGESVASATVFTIVALVFMKSMPGKPGGDQYFTYWPVLTVAVIGGLLGILFMIPLRRSLIVKEHGRLLYPEGTACAEVLVAGEKSTDIARPVFAGALVASGYTLLMKLFRLWNETPFVIERLSRSFYNNAILTLSISPETLGVGYVIGPRASAQMMAGGLLACLVFIPLFSEMPTFLHWLQHSSPKIFALVHLQNLKETLDGFNIPVTAEDLATPSRQPGLINLAYVRWIGVGAVVTAGLATLVRSLPLIGDSFKGVVRALKDNKIRLPGRTERDIPIWIVLAGAGVLVTLVGVLPYLPGKLPGSLLLSLLVLVFGFFFVAVSSRYVAIAGYSSEPVSPTTYSTAIIACLLFIALGWTSDKSQAMVVLVASVVCMAAGNAGATSQDLKTGFLLGATPWKQQAGLVIGVVVSAFVGVGILLLIDRSQQPKAVHAIGSQDFVARQAFILSSLVQAFLNGKMPWALLGLGAVIALIAEFTGLISLSVAAGLYLPPEVSVVMFIGGMVRWATTRHKNKPKQAHGTSKEEELSPGMLYATGFIAGGALLGLFVEFFRGFSANAASKVDIGQQYWIHHASLGKLVALLAFAVLVYLLYRKSQRKK